MVILFKLQNTMSKRNQIPGQCVCLWRNPRMRRDVYNHKCRYSNARPILNNTVNSHETRNSSARGSLVLRSQNINLKQKRYKKENAERLLKIGPFFSFLYNFSSLVNKTILQRVFLFVFMSFFCLFLWVFYFVNRPFNGAQVLSRPLQRPLQ